MDNDTIERDVLIDAPAARVWELITQPDHIAAWWGPTNGDIAAELDDLREGGTLKLTFEGYGTFPTRIEEVDEPRSLAIRWASFEAGAEPVEGNSTLIRFSLAPEGEGTRLSVVESGFASLKYSDEDRLQSHRNNTEGWRSVFEALQRHATKVAA